jgi:ribokinase
MKFDVITFGSAVTDVFVDTDISEKNNFISYPVGSKILIKNIRYDIGGGGTNTAVAFSRLGLKTGYIGKVGRDENGQEILQLLKKENIKFLGKKDKHFMTGYSIILDSKGGDRTILTYKGANDEILLSDLKLRKLKTKWLYFSSLLGKSLETQIELAKIMKKRGTKIAFNPSSYIADKRHLILPMLKLTNILILNKEEAQMLSGKKDNLLEHLHDLGPKTVIITDKNKSISCYDGKKKYSLKPHHVRVVERTGAGDAFAAGFVAGVIAHLAIEDSLKLGLKESESVLKYFGAKNKLLRMKLR